MKEESGTIMAEKLVGYKTHGLTKYDWESWLDGSAWKLTRGIDFSCDVSAFRAVAYAAAKRCRKKITVRKQSDDVIIVVAKVSPVIPN